MGNIKYLTLTRVAVKKSDYVSLNGYSNKITSSQCAVNFCRELFGDTVSIYESFYALYLNTAMEVVSYALISQGGIRGTVVDGKIIFINAIKTLCHGIVLLHNHPSGNINPSEADKKLTQNLVSFAKQIDLHILDHIIITEDSHFSFSNEGLIR